jgi:glycosyltransferase involved in cell wall biosynthesis
MSPTGKLFREERRRLSAFEFNGFYPSRDHADSVWLRDRARLQLPHPLPLSTLTIEGYFLPADETNASTKGNTGLMVSVLDRVIGESKTLPEGPFSLSFRLPEESKDRPFDLQLRLLGVGWTNTLAFLGRVGQKVPLVRSLVSGIQPFREQGLNRRLRLRRILVDDTVLLDFGQFFSPFNYEITHRYSDPGLNIVGWFDAALGIGESARLSARSADSVSLKRALIPLRLNCKAPRNDQSFSDQLQEENPYPCNLFHLDAPQAIDIDHHHGRHFREGKYNIAYLAWELPEFPDTWIRYLRFFDEVWVPSRFVQDSIGRKSALPVLTMPHAIEFPAPKIEGARARFGLPDDKTLFLFIYDLNSYQERKNPAAVLEAYKKALALGLKDAALVIKVHSVKGNEADFGRLQQEAKALPNTYLINEALSREDVYRLEAACDAFVSLHRSEGFGLCVAECMFIGRPVIATDWSATAEFLNETNGCPVPYELIELKENHGPYTKGQIWADPDTTAAANWMVKLAADPSLRQRLGQAARRTMQEGFSYQRVGKLYQDRLKALLLS